MRKHILKRRAELCLFNNCIKRYTVPSKSTKVKQNGDEDIGEHYCHVGLKGT